MPFVHLSHPCGKHDSGTEARSMCYCIYFLIYLYRLYVESLKYWHHAQHKSVAENEFLDFPYELYFVLRIPKKINRKQKDVFCL